MFTIEKKKRGLKRRDNILAEKGVCFSDKGTIFCRKKALFQEEKCFCLRSVTYFVLKC